MFNDMASIKHYKSPEQKLYLKATIVESLALTLSLLNIGKNMDVRQVEATCELLIDDTEFQILNPAEIREAFTRGIKGSYGKIYDAVDISIVCGWLRSYVEERFAAIERYREQEIAALRADTKTPFKALAKIKLSNPIGDPREDKQPHKPAPRKKTAAELELDGYLAEFDKLEDLKIAETGKVVDYKGAFYGVSDYCNKRYEEARV